MTYYDAGEAGGHFGLPKTTTDPHGRVTTYTYDDYGRVAQRTMTDGGNTRTITFTYDAFGRTVKIDDTGYNADGITRHTYDAEGRLTQIDRSAATNGAILNHGYDVLGRLERTWTSKTTSGVDAITDTRYQHDELSRLVEVEVIERDDTLLPISEKHIYAYVADGRLDYELLANGVTKDYVYDALGRIEDLTHFIDLDGDYTWDPGETLQARFQYTYDKANNRTSSTETIDGQTQAFTYQYDALNRLIEEDFQGPGGTGSYTDTFAFDLSSNRLSYTRTDNDGNDSYTTTYAYDDNDRLLAETKAHANDSNLNRHTVYSFNDGGDQTGKTVYQGQDDSGTVLETRAQTFGPNGRLEQVTITAGGNTTTVDYTYSESGFRVQTIADNGTTTTTTRFVFDTNNPTGYGQILEERDASGNPAITYTLGRDVLTQSETTGPASGTHHLLYDVHGSTRALLTAASALLEAYTYTAYGSLHNFTGSPLTQIQYAGEYIDPITALHSLRARWYDSNSARFTQADPLKGRSPATLNAYAYVNANPINMIDPSGLAGFSATSLLITVSIGAAIGALGAGTAQYALTGTVT